MKKKVKYLNFDVAEERIWISDHNEKYDNEDGQVRYNIVSWRVGKVDDDIIGRLVMDNFKIFKQIDDEKDINTDGIEVSSRSYYTIMSLESKITEAQIAQINRNDDKNPLNRLEKYLYNLTYNGGK